MNEEQRKEYEEHYSPDGERIEYLIEHPEESEKWTCVDCGREVEKYKAQCTDCRLEL